MGKIVEIPWDGSYKVGDEVETPEGPGLIVRVLPGPQKFHVEVPPPPKKASPKTIPPGTMLVNPEGRIFGVIQEDGTILEKEQDDVEIGGDSAKEEERKEEGESLEGNEEETVGENEEDDEGTEGEGTGVLILQPIYDKGEPTGEYLCAKCGHTWKPVKLPKQCPKCKAKEVGD